jgi:PII-like signaling protein
MDWSSVAQGLFFFGWSCIAIWVARSIEGLGKSVESMKDSVGELNVHVAVVIEKVGNHEKRIEWLERND